MQKYIPKVVGAKSRNFVRFCASVSAIQNLRLGSIKFAR
jgi:hypothetical protein